MIGWLSGRVVHQQEDTIVLNVNGVGYELSVSGRALASVANSAPEETPELTLVVYTDVRENAIALYGFLDQLEREVFLLLKKVKGVGSKVALAIVSWLEPERVLAAIAQADLSSLQTVPGVGKKLAERIAVELREQVGELVRDNQQLKPRLPHRIERVTVEGFATRDLPTEQGDVVMALEKLGFSIERAREVVLRVVAQQPSGASVATEELLRLSLANL